MLCYCDVSCSLRSKEIIYFVPVERVLLKELLATINLYWYSMYCEGIFYSESLLKLNCSLHLGLSVSNCICSYKVKYRVFGLIFSNSAKIFIVKVSVHGQLGESQYLMLRKIFWDPIFKWSKAVWLANGQVFKWSSNFRLKRYVYGLKYLEL